MSVDLKVTHYDTGEDYFTFTIDRSVNYNLDEYELSQISYMYLDRCLIKYLTGIIGMREKKIVPKRSLKAPKKQCSS
jgi:hypothetical protein